MRFFDDSLRQLGFELHINSTGQVPYLLPPLCTIPTGAFLMGSDPSVDRLAAPEECPQHAVWLSTYQIGKYPVTVAEYAWALQAAAPGVRMPVNWEAQHSHPTWPVHGLTWDDALEYTHWLAQLTGQAWRLPTDAEWEKAARGPHGRIYPWGNQWEAGRANVSLEVLPGDQSITSVDAYPRGASWYGVMDLVGNVGEWTSTVYDPEPFPYPYVATDGREDLEGTHQFRGLRGGCWLFPPERVRAAARDCFHTQDRYDWLHGMRLACAPLS